MTHHRSHRRPPWFRPGRLIYLLIVSGFILNILSNIGSDLFLQGPQAFNDINQWRNAYIVQLIERYPIPAIIIGLLIFGLIVEDILYTRKLMQNLAYHNDTVSEKNRLELIEQSGFQIDQEFQMATQSIIVVPLHLKLMMVSRLGIVHGDYLSTPIDSNETIIDIYSRSNGRLLIVGAPGGGKSTQLTILASQLMQNAKEDQNKRVPVIFPLSTWAQEKYPIENWLVEQLANPLYNIPKRLGRLYLENNEILPLLDGLDEMLPHEQNECVAAINTYLENSGAPLIITCRVEEYKNLSIHLNVSQLVEVQGLNDDLISTYLISGGTKYAGLLQAIKQDTGLRELASTPLMLSIMARTYVQIPYFEIPRKLPLVDIQERIFNEYVTRMLERGIRKNKAYYDPKHVCQWLSRLARQMQQRRMSRFYIEQLQPDWVRWIWLTRFIFGVFVGLVIAIINWLVDGRVILGFIIGFSVEIFLEFAYDFMKRHIDVSSRKGFRESTDLVILKSLESYNKVQLRDRLRISRLCIIGGLSIGLGAGLSISLSSGNILLGGSIIFIFITVFGTISLLIDPISSNIENITYRTPNGGIIQTGLNALFVSLFAMIGAGIGSGIARGLHVGVIVGVIGGIIGGLIFGLSDVFFHMCIRFVLFCEDDAPINYARFLNYCDSCILLKRTGGGYDFIHRLLLEYFAKL